MTEKVADCPTDTVRLAGCVVIEGAIDVGAGAMLPHPAITKNKMNSEAARVFFTICIVTSHPDLVPVIH